MTGALATELHPDVDGVVGVEPTTSVSLYLVIRDGSPRDANLVSFSLNLSGHSPASAIPPLPHKSGRQDSNLHAPKSQARPLV